jgi:hypothetical protein
MLAGVATLEPSAVHALGAGGVEPMLALRSE